VERIKIAETRSGLKRPNSRDLELKETHVQRVPQRRCRIHFGESELRETNPCVSILVCLTICHSSFTLCFRWIYLVVLFLCVQVLEIYLTSSAEALHQVTFVLELKEGRTLIFEHLNRFCTGSVCLVTPIGLIGCLLFTAVKSWTDLIG